MTSFHALTQNRMRVGLVALVVVAALVLPQLAWADHGSDHPYGQFDDPAVNSASDHYAALLEKYESGELVYHAPGRRDDTSFGSSASDTFSADSARWTAQGQFYQEGFARAAAADSARWAALGQHHQHAFARAVSADTARWAAQGAFFATQEGCSVSDAEC